MTSDRPKHPQQGSQPDPTDENSAGSIDRQIAAICERFEQQWRQGETPPDIAEYLPAQWASAQRHNLVVELVKLDIEYRRRRGESVNAGDYSIRFSDLDQQQLVDLPNSNDLAPGMSILTDRISAAGGTGGTAVDDAGLPESIGRYRVESLLGEGGFGRVYLAHDDELQRPVAIKVPRLDRITNPADLDAYLDEARFVAGLNHANIVPVYDVGREEGGLCYVVARYIAGCDLREWPRVGYVEAADLVATLAEALHAAHECDLVHCDVKPANILIDAEGTPYLCDFGLALRDVDFGRGGTQYAGTPAYMSPEQARGEGHRVDGRSDIFSLGIVFYELLTGRRPFLGDRTVELLDQISSCDVRPPRQRRSDIPRELERICLKALSRRISDRYTTARDMSEDLHAFLARRTDESSGAARTEAGFAPTRETPSSEISDPKNDSNVSPREHTPSDASPDSDSDSRPLRIVPKGLRSFDEHDADFFLALLPGARDRDGLPDSIRFWKQRIEERDSDKTFSVGLIYGPSGCGKSSLVKAGLLPRLAAHVVPIYIEATPDDTETRLVRSLHNACPDLDRCVNLQQMLADLRRGHGIRPDQNVVIVLDQFEQWLHGRRDEEDADLIQALRQCEGGRVQCIVMVRDDFWMAATRFMREVEVRLVESQNSAAVDLFPIRHAEKVLAAFGRAFGILPDNVGDQHKEQGTFLTESVVGLAEEGKVVSVRLALFADMMKGRPWSPASLKAVGGTRGVGVTFLEETFSASAAPPEHRFHQKAARAVLNALLPDSGTDIKGHMRSHSDLLQASGYGNRPKDFDGLIHVLDSEIRLITPTDPEGQTDDPESASPTEAGQKYYQLTHDYLVPSLRDWLKQKQKETRRGRAELKLEERTALWSAKSENRRLPSLWEYGDIRLLTEKEKWTEPQRAMMRRATRAHAVRWGTAVAIVLLVGLTIWRILDTGRRENFAKRLENSVNAMATASWYKVPDAINELNDFPPEMVRQSLQRKYARATAGQKLSLAYALAAYDQVELEFLLSQIAGAPGNECANIVTALDRDKDKAIRRLTTLAEEADKKADWMLKGRLAVVALQLGDAGIAEDIHTNINRPDPSQQTVFIHDVFPTWHGDLQRLHDEATEIEDGGLRHGICLALGQMAFSDLGESRQHWHELIQGWFTNSPDTGTHSAAAWALGQWGIDLPAIATDNEPPEDRDWQLTKTGLTLLRIPAGEFELDDGKTKQAVTLTRSFWLADREVSRGLFQQFINDEEYPSDHKPKGWEGINTRISPTDRHPAQSVSWEDAVLFCKWLSQQEDLEPCYDVELLAQTDGESGATALQVELNASANGYRLPTEAEWEYACRAGTTTDYCFGDDTERLRRYAVYGATETEVVGSRMCNRRGLWDMHGNVFEWCCYGRGRPEPTLSVDSLGPARGSLRVSRGASWDNLARLCQSGPRFSHLPTYRSHFLGIRVARGPSVSQSSSGAESGSR